MKAIGSWRAHLERYGLNVLVVGDGQQALKLLRDSFDLVLLDCQMPVLMVLRPVVPGVSSNRRVAGHVCRC